VYEFAKVFRNEGIDTRHNPEFTLLELYQAYADYEVMMDITEELIATAAHNGWDSDGLFEQSSDMYRQAAKLLDDHQIPEGVLRRIVELGLDGADDQVGKLLQTIDAENPEFGERLVYEDFVWRARAFQQAASLQGQGRNCLPYGKQVIDYTRPWPRWTYAELVKKHAYVDWNKNSDADVRAKAHALGLNHTNDLPVVVNDIFELVVEPELAKPSEAYDVPGADGKLVHIEVLRPTFVMDYPAELCPLTRRKADDPSVALRFECFIAGMEIANAYTELNDPAVQEENFRQQLRGEAANETMRVMDEDFVTALRQGMPPAGGLGIGIDRVIMLLTNRQSIRDVVLFPLLRPTEEK
jgi:lysyl-tRNA synthetase class 2